jgi:hypothetical protein
MGGLPAFSAATKTLLRVGARRGPCLECLLTIHLRLQFWDLGFFWRRRLHFAFDAHLTLTIGQTSVPHTLSVSIPSANEHAFF